MDQLKSNEINPAIKKEDTKEFSGFVPQRKFTLEFFVGLFSAISLLVAGYLAVGLGGLDINSANDYKLKASFDNVSGLKTGASVEIAGVKIGDVTDISLEDSQAIVTMKIDNQFRIQDDDIAMVRTKGIIGDRFVKISRGASEEYLKDGDMMFETESVVDFEDIIGKIVHSFTGDEKKEGE